MNEDLVESPGGDDAATPLADPDDAAIAKAADERTESPGSAATPSAHVDDEEPEAFVRYQNSLYRLISLVGAAFVAVLGITGIAIGATLDPSPPPGFYWTDAAFTIVFFVWYLLGLRCRLDLGETQVHIATKYGDFRVDRTAVVGIEADHSVWGTLQWSGRPLRLHYTRSDAVRTRRAFGCLPTDRLGQDAAIAALQEALGSPDDTRFDELDAMVSQRLAAMEPEGGDVVDLAANDNRHEEPTVDESNGQSPVPPS